MGLFESRMVPGSASTSVSWDVALGDVAQLSERVSRLPAIATLDWCDHAAGCLAELSKALHTCVMISTIDIDGRIRDIEAIGFATDRSHDATRTSDLRCRAEGWDQLGVRRFDIEGGASTVIAEEIGGDRWATAPIGRTWSEMGAQRSVISISPLGPAKNGRCLVAIVATPAATQAQTLALEIRAILPVLMRRALMAIGPDRTRRNNWISPKELDVLDQLVLGKSVREIAKAMDRSPHTVHDHVKSLHRKLGASSRGELIARALGHHSVVGNVAGATPKVDGSDYASI
jgi:DNA-binding CsgD family transcriptional regulator